MDLFTPSNCLTFNLQRAARALARRMDAALAPLGLTAQQFSALAILSGDAALSTSGIAERIGAERTTVTRNMRVLSRRGLVAPVADSDARINAYQLTETGRALLAQALPAWREAQSRAIDRLDSPDGPGPAAVLTALHRLS